MEGITDFEFSLTKMYFQSAFECELQPSWYTSMCKDDFAYHSYLQKKKLRIKIHFGQICLTLKILKQKNFKFLFIGINFGNC